MQPSPSSEVMTPTSHLPDLEEIELIREFQRNPLLLAKSKPLRHCLLRNILCETAPPHLSIPPVLNLEPLKNFDPILEAIYKAPTTTFWDKTNIALDMFEFILVDPVLCLAANHLWGTGATKEQPFVTAIVEHYDYDMKAHFFPKPGATNRTEDNPEERRSVMARMVGLAALRTSNIQKRHSVNVEPGEPEEEVDETVQEVFDVCDTLRECLEMTHKEG